ncbi:uncharacterized protein [Diabrotica undecimpunctata]|uniref:uncharacterized protein n=1 Tax=Diabrotica undecimpunctata TaxID=50387 RepID=UPI003B637CB6
MAVRNMLYDMDQQKKHITLMSLTCQLRDEELVDIGKSSLSTLLKDIGFKFKKDDNRRAIIEQTSIAALRARFLLKYMENLESVFTRKVVFLDETWIYSTWQDNSAKSVRKAGGYNGKRFVIVHAGSRKGFVSGENLLFCSKSNVADYHGEMNNELFTKWIRTQLIPNLEEPSLVVMDHDSYRSALLNKQPSTTSRKDEIIS